MSYASNAFSFWKSKDSSNANAPAQSTLTLAQRVVELLHEKNEALKTVDADYPSQATEINALLKKLAQKLETIATVQVQNKDEYIEPPSEDPVGNFTGQAENPTNDIVLVCSNSGAEPAKDLSDRLSTFGYKCAVLLCPDAGINARAAEELVASSQTVILILSKDCFSEPSLLFASKAALLYDKRIICAHYQASCIFPGVQVQPRCLRESDVFHNKAVTYIQQYAETCVDQIVAKIKRIVSQNVHTRAFISHKRSSAQGMAGRLYEGLKGDYRVFLDTEADFDLHDLKEIIRNTEVVLVILSEGLLDSHWCMQEVRAAKEYKKRIIFIRDWQYKLPNPFPEHVADLKQLILEGYKIDYMAEFYQQCVEKLKAEIGPSDRLIEEFEQLDENASFLPAVTAGAPYSLNVKLSPAFKLKEFVHALEKKYNIPVADVKSLFLDATSCKLEDDDLSELKHVANAVHGLNLSFCDITDKGVNTLIELYRNLKSVSFAGCQISNNSVYLLLESCPGLTSLDISETPVSDQALKVIGELGKDITELRISAGTGLMSITDEGMQHVATGCTKLATIDLTHCHKVTDQSLLLLSKCSALTTANLTKMPITNEGLRHLVEACNLINLNIDHTPITDVGLTYISQSCRNIKTLNVSHCPASDAGVKLLASCQNLTDLVLTALPITDEAVTSVVRGCPNMSHLNLDNCFQLTDKSLNAISESCRLLKSLHLQANTKYTDAGFETVFNGCRKLESINLSGTNASNSTLQSLAKSLPDLQYLDLSTCSISNEGLLALSQTCHNLRTLILAMDLGPMSSTPDISDEAIAAIANSCPELRNLNVLCCSALTDAPFIKLAECCRKLRTLNLRGLDAIGDATLIAIANGCHLIQSINITQCYNITSEGKEAIVGKLIEERSFMF